MLLAGYAFSYNVASNLMNTLTLEPTNEAVAEAIVSSNVGDVKTLVVTGTVTRVGERFVLEVESARSAEIEDENALVEEEVDEEAVETPSYRKPDYGSKSSPVMAQSKKGPNPAMVLLIGKK